MRFVCFYHSLISDWSNGSAPFLRGVISDLLDRGHEVRVYEPRTSWSVMNLLRDHGDDALAAFHAAYPALSSERYDEAIDIGAALDRADVVLVHDWTDPLTIARIGKHRASHHYTLLLHDTHHRAITAPNELAALALDHYDGVLTVGAALRDVYLARGWAARAWAWHGAADVRWFMPHVVAGLEGDVVWIGNWGGDDRAADLRRMLIDPIARLRLSARVYGARYPQYARHALEAAGIPYGGWIPHFRIPAVYSHHRVTINVPHRIYADRIPGVPTPTMFEALACGIPLVSAPWCDPDGMFAAGEDYLVAKDGEHMTHLLELVLHDRDFAHRLAEHGRQTVLSRHTCMHRVDELLAIVALLRPAGESVFASVSAAARGTAAIDEHLGSG